MILEIIYIYEPRNYCAYLGSQADSTLQQLTEPRNQVPQHRDIEVLQTLSTKDTQTHFKPTHDFNLTLSHLLKQQTRHMMYLPSWSYHIDSLHHWGGLGCTQPGSIHSTLKKTERERPVMKDARSGFRVEWMSRGGWLYLLLLRGSETEVVKDLGLQSAEGFKQGRNQPGSVRL